MSYVFAFSYGKPFVGTYTPPSCAFNRVTMNFTVTSKGVQFDRLGIMYLGDIEVFRTSTAEPTKNGIVWTYVKEMEQYNSLWKSEQKIIFDLGNLIDSTYTGTFNTTLTATFFSVPEPDTKPIADIILPISSRQSAENKGSAFTVPADNASIAYTLPQNIDRAVVSLSACGQATEEFWYTNTFSSQVNTFESTAGTLYGYSPFREVQLLIDGQLAGVSWPFPIIFTGGIAPGFWRPIVGIDAFDLREHEIDVTPWLPLLCDGKEHSFEIRVAGLDDDGKDHATITETVGSNWVVTGKIFIFSGRQGSITRGSSPQIQASPPEIMITSSLTTNSTGGNQSLNYNTRVFREISITSMIDAAGGSQKASWYQRLVYNNVNVLTAQGFDQTTNQSTVGSDQASSGYSNEYMYPLNVESSFSINAAGNVGINASLSRGLTFDPLGPSVFPNGVQNFNILNQSLVSIPGQTPPQTIQLASNTIPRLSGSRLSTTQAGTAKYLSAGNASYSFGATSQDFQFEGVENQSPQTTLELYRQTVTAVNSTLTQNDITAIWKLLGASPPLPNAVPANAVPVAARSVRSLLGRGPGTMNVGLIGPGGAGSSVGTS